LIPAKESDLVHERGGNTLACSSGFEKLAAGVHPATGPHGSFFVKTPASHLTRML
jgi:hypothetical protein